MAILVAHHASGGIGRLNGVVVGGHRHILTPVVHGGRGTGDGERSAKVPAVCPDRIFTQLAAAGLFTHRRMENHDVIDKAVCFPVIAVTVEVVTVFQVVIGEVYRGVSGRGQQRLAHQRTGIAIGVVAIKCGGLARHVPAGYTAFHAVTVAGLLPVELLHGQQVFTLRADKAVFRKQQLAIVRRCVIRVIHVGFARLDAVVREIREFHQDGKHAGGLVGTGVAFWGQRGGHLHFALAELVALAVLQGGLDVVALRVGEELGARGHQVATALLRLCGALFQVTAQRGFRFRNGGILIDASGAP